MTKIRILHEDCDPTLADDKSLPTSAFLITYIEDGREKYDIAMCNKQVELFDHYYDKYKKNLKSFTQTAGNIKPKLYNGPKKEG